MMTNPNPHMVYLGKEVITMKSGGINEVLYYAIPGGIKILYPCGTPEPIVAWHRAAFSRIIECESGKLPKCTINPGIDDGIGPHWVN